MARLYTIREHERLRPRNKQDLNDLMAFARANQRDRQGKYRPILVFGRDGALRAANYVGIITTKRRTVVEILPKIDLGGEPDPDHEETRRVFLNMLRTWRRWGAAAHLPESAVRSVRHFPMLEAFVRLFLDNLGRLVRGGLGRRYVRVEENLPYLRGRILFRDQLRENLTNRARFFVEHDELSINRPANRLIHSAVAKLKPVVRNDENRQMLRNMEAAFVEVPQAGNVRSDWRKHSVDRSMQHYKPVMQWVGLFLFNRGLATWSGRHVNQSLLFPMEEIYEDFVTHSFRRRQDKFTVIAQGPSRNMAETEGGPAATGRKRVFWTRPDISLRDGNGRVRFILDAKWKRVGAKGGYAGDDIDQADVYQLYAYGKLHGCKTVALLYPRSRHFTTELIHRFFDGLKLICLPFDVADPKGSVSQALRVLEGSQ